MTSKLGGIPQLHIIQCLIRASSEILLLRLQETHDSETTQKCENQSWSKKEKRRNATREIEGSRLISLNE